MKRKIRMTGMLATTLRESFESIQRTDSETETEIETMDDELNAMPIDALLHRTSSSSSLSAGAGGGAGSPIRSSSASSPSGRAMIRKTIVRVLSIGGALAPVEEVPSAAAGGGAAAGGEAAAGTGGGAAAGGGAGTGAGWGGIAAARKNLFSQITSGNGHKLKKVDYQMEAAAEAVAEANRRHEKSEQLRLWPEIKSLVAKAHLEISFDDLTVLSKIGEGKFASVHCAELSMKLHSKVFVSSSQGHEGVRRTLERVGNNLNQLEFGLKDLRLPCALKVLEYLEAYPLVGGDWEHDRPVEKDDRCCDDEEVYTRHDECEVTTTMEREELEGKREGGRGAEGGGAGRGAMGAAGGGGGAGMADGHHEDPNCLQSQETQPFHERYRTMPPSKSILESLREIRALSILQHQNIVMLHGVVLVPRLILVMERMQHNLGDLLTMPSDQLQVFPPLSCTLFSLLLFLSRPLSLPLSPPVSSSPSCPLLSSAVLFCRSN
jgi:hypothetical protein